MNLHEIIIHLYQLLEDCFAININKSQDKENNPRSLLLKDAKNIFCRKR